MWTYLDFLAHLMHHNKWSEMTKHQHKMDQSLGLCRWTTNLHKPHGPRNPNLPLRPLVCLVTKRQYKGPCVVTPSDWGLALTSWICQRQLITADPCLDNKNSQAACETLIKRDFKLG